MIESRLLASRSEVVAENGVVAAGHPAAARAGVRIMQEGGNAIDATVAAAFAAFVVEPASCGLGGYGRLSIYRGPQQDFVTVDHYVRAPQRAHAGIFALDDSKSWHYYGHPQTLGRQAEKGPLSPAVPGAVAGLYTAQRHFGRLPWAQVLAPAIELAEAGLPVTWDLTLVITARLAEIKEMPALAAFLLPHGHPPGYDSRWVTQDRLDTSDLARTLRLIAAGGAAAFYHGPIAAAIEAALAAHGGLLTAADLAAYRPRVLREQPARYRQTRYITAYDQVAYEALNILDQFDLAALGPDSVGFRHLTAEALGHAFMDNKVHYGDPDFERSPVNGLASRAFAAHRAAQIDLQRAAPRPIAPGDPWPFEDQALAPERLSSLETVGKNAGTSQVVAADREGNVTALITSLSSAFGSLVMVPGTGIILNNAMQNFDPRPDHPNRIQPGKMPIFAAPALVATADGRPLFAGAGSGGYRIMTGVLHTFMHAVDFGLGIQAAVDAPRVHCQGHETIVDARIPAAVRERLAAMGHQVETAQDSPAGDHFGRVAALWIDPQQGTLYAGSGPAWQTAAAGF